MTDHETLAKRKKRTVFGPHLRSKNNGKIHYFVNTPDWISTHIWRGFFGDVQTPVMKKADSFWSAPLLTKYAKFLGFLGDVRSSVFT
jgi:hypothetical protein